jgi:hypothetical protein
MKLNDYPPHLMGGGQVATFRTVLRVAAPRCAMASCRKAETKAEGFKGNQHVVLPNGGKKLKKDAIKASGLSTSAAHRAEALAGARSDLDDQMQVEALGIARGSGAGLRTEGARHCSERRGDECAYSRISPEQRRKCRSILVGTL